MNLSHCAGKPSLTASPAMPKLSFSTLVHFDTRESLEAAQEKVEALAVELTNQARREFGEQCLREMEWLEARGLDADYLPEVDGESRYFVTAEDVPGSMVSQGCRHYE